MADFFDTMILPLKYDSFLVSSKNAYFRVISVRGSLYVVGFSDEIKLDHEVFVYGQVNASDLAKITGNHNHFGRVIGFSKNDNYVAVEVTFVSTIEHLDDFNIRLAKNDILESDLRDYTKNDIEGVSFALAAYTTKDQKNSSFRIVNLPNRDRAFSVNKEEKDGFYFAIENGPRPFGNKGSSKNVSYRFAILTANYVFSKESKNNSTVDIIKLEKMQMDTTSYLSLWDQYNSIEKINSFNKAKKQSYVYFNRLESKKKGLYRFVFDEVSYAHIRDLEEGAFLVIGNHAIKNLFEGIETPEDYLDLENELHESSDEASENEKQFLLRGILQKKMDTEHCVFISVSDSDIEKLSFCVNGGYIARSLIGDMTVFKRRMKAKNLIWSGKCGIPNLFTFFSDNPSPSAKSGKIEINHSLIEHNLTENQLEALNIICNTPDIAVIQGPPGTGKSTIIEMAIKQINSNLQLTDKYANNLLCSFRHETVEDITGKVTIFGLPAVKLGNSGSADSNTLIEKSIEHFIDDLKEKLSNKYKDTEAITNNHEFFDKYNNYVSFSCSLDESRNILEYVLGLAVVNSDEDLKRKVNSLIDRVNHIGNKVDFYQESFMEFLRKAPTTEASFADGGEDFLLELQYTKFKTPGVQRDASAFLECYKGEISWKKVEYARKKLIVKYRTVEPVFIEKPLKHEICEVLSEIRKRFELDSYTNSDGIHRAIGEYIRSLDENPKLLRDTILEYSRAVGTTNQQSYSHVLSQTFFDKNNSFFENVFVDEAATSSPLDLFLPMSLATRRIVLVGDHFQLPNIINEEIAEEIENESEEHNVEKIRDALKKTLFERLFETCKTLEQLDGFKRVITLDSQFRMHPEIGNIVSKHFYGGVIKSSKAESEFKHSFLGFENQPFHWFHIPYLGDRKKQGRENNSRFNIPEAQLIAEKIKEAINREDYAGESIGVITFYKPQVKILKDLLFDKGLLPEQGKNVVYNDKQEEIVIEVGTVDAFQGKQFDIVFLSTVYTFDPEDYEKMNYSRLTIKNLLCVALSRAKKSLITVGNIDIYKNERSRGLVPSLSEVASICEERNLVD